MSSGTSSSSSTMGAEAAAIQATVEWWIQMIQLLYRVESWHTYLPYPMNRIMDVLLLNHVMYGDEILFSICVVLCIAIVIQTKALSRPPPVPNKVLPKRPCLYINFQPDDPSSSNIHKNTNNAALLSEMNGNTNTIKNKARSFIQQRITDGIMKSRRILFRHSSSSNNNNNINSNSDMKSSFQATVTNNINTTTTVQTPSTIRRRYINTPPQASQHQLHEQQHNRFTPTSSSSRLFGRSNSSNIVETVFDDDDDYEEDLHDNEYLVDDEKDQRHDYDDIYADERLSTTFTQQQQDQLQFLQDLLPDSFAPLLSSSYMSMNTQQLTPDLIHAVQVEGVIRLKSGRYEIPLDKDTSRPQLIFNISGSNNNKDSSGTSKAKTSESMSSSSFGNKNSTKTTTTTSASDGGVGCRISAVAVIGSDTCTMEQDMDVNLNTTERNKPIVKHAGLVFDPAIPLCNVAPTVIHFPTLFEDRYMIPTLRSIQFVRYIVDFIVSISSLLEKCLWIIESQCQIHISKVRITPIYKGQYKNSHTATTDTTKITITKSPKWRLQIAFSGHVLVFGFIPIPFISIVLPSFIIPQPHALLEYLLSSQPLASARIRRENIAVERIALAVLDTVDSWTTNVKIVATPPALAVDLTLPGGVSIAVETGLWRDHQAGRERENNAFDRQQKQNGGADNKGVGESAGAAIITESIEDNASINSMSSWSTKQPQSKQHYTNVLRQQSSPSQFDANLLVPWMIELSAKGTVGHEKLSLHVLKFSATHSGSPPHTVPVQERSQFVLRGSFAIWKMQNRSRALSVDSNNINRTLSNNASVIHSVPRHQRSRSGGLLKSSSAHPELETEDSPSVAAIFLYPDETSSFRNDLRMLQYDYLFDVAEDSKLDAVTVSIGASHPMLNGDTMITTILDSIYAFGSIAAREDSVLDPIERRRKRNILRHLPAIDFSFGIQNIYIPVESESYSDDGQSLFLPEIEGGRMMIRFLGGMDESEELSVGSTGAAIETVSDGVKLVADFEIPSLVVHVDSFVKEFPELDIREGIRLHTLLSGLIGGSINAHLRPQKLSSNSLTTGPNVLNPLEAYEIDFSRSSLSLKMKEFSSTLGHRRIMFPAETTLCINVLKSVVDMGFEGTTKCELSWDFQGLSPILQITTPGLSPADALPENKVQVSLLISPLRQGRFSMNVSSVGGISITKAVTSREDKEGLYDWKFFNALISPDKGSMGRILDVLNDTRTIDKLLQIVKVVNEDLHEIFRYSIKKLRRAKEILDQEGVVDPGNAIPIDKLSRLISLFLTDDVLQVDKILPIVRRVIVGDGLDVVKLKDLLRRNFELYDIWSPEIDRVSRWAAICLGPMPIAQPYVEDQVTPLAEILSNKMQFQSIPSASQLYETLLDKPQLPLDPGFSNLASRIAPYLSFRQVEYILEVRAPADWQPSDLRRIRYVYSIKRKVLEIAESYGGLSFLPQSFFLSVFLGEATRSSLRASNSNSRNDKTKSKQLYSVRSFKRSRVSVSTSVSSYGRNSNFSGRSKLRHNSMRNESSMKENSEDPPQNDMDIRTRNFNSRKGIPESLVLRGGESKQVQHQYELGDSLLGPQDVAILLQSGLTSVMKSSTVVQLNQRMLLDLICSQPRTFAIAVLAEIGNTPRSLTSALMALLELDQTAFKPDYQIDMHALIESWLPEIKIPRREDHMAGGRWARFSYYDALFSIAVNISGDAETYTALKNHVQQVRHTTESSPLPQPREGPNPDDASSTLAQINSFRGSSKITGAISKALSFMAEADAAGKIAVEKVLLNFTSVLSDEDCIKATQLYHKAFDACAQVLAFDKHAFHSNWFSEYYRRNYNALMVLSMYDNVMEDVDRVRYWLGRLLRGAMDSTCNGTSGTGSDASSEWLDLHGKGMNFPDNIFEEPHNFPEQLIVDAIIEATIFDAADRNKLRNDPLVRLLIQNPPGNYNFIIVSAAGVITEGARGLELKDAFDRLDRKRGVKVIRADTATARSIEYNAGKVEEAIEEAVRLKKPYGLLGYSQGCANALMAESMLFSGTPKQQQTLFPTDGGLVCRQLLFSAANGSFHGPAVERKIQRLITMCEDFFKSQSGYYSKTFSSTVLAFLNSILDSADFHKIMGGAQSFLPDGCRAFWRESQHLSHVPTCVLRGVMENHTTPESLEMLSNLLTKQSGSALHDSQVHVFDAVGYPVYHLNRNGKVLKQCAVGDGAIQRTHHWSPLSDEVEFVRTVRDIEMASFDCAKDRHVFPWVEVNKRFGFIKFATDNTFEAHPAKFKSENKI